MTQNAVYHLSNLAAGQEFELTVADGADALRAAQAHLEQSGLAAQVRDGFYLSVYPREPDGSSEPVSVGGGAAGAAPADDGTIDDGSIDDAAILA